MYVTIVALNNCIVFLHIYFELYMHLFISGFVYHLTIPVLELHICILMYEYRSLFYHVTKLEQTTKKQMYICTQCTYEWGTSSYDKLMCYMYNELYTCIHVQSNSV